MGMFDTIWAKCPCGEDLGFQTKGGACCLYEWELDNAPDDAMSDVNRHSPLECDNCKRQFEVNIAERKLVVLNDLPAPSLEAKEEMPPIVKFLLGEDEFMGQWFGDNTGRAGFWWRKYLRELYTPKV